MSIWMIYFKEKNVSQILYFICVDNLVSSSASFITIYTNINYFCFLKEFISSWIYFFFFP